ncbi:ThuA domain-containing protein [Agromyces seonyuensis]|uniref:ThuA domain-containing protein n=1 Tax=Agromyces seonyuensis TaxID=2662446 RepID=A0A6I4NWH5_9MICO|nr:ThuA domain-containing protein [Agromyces seonyuensis]MWB98511.1 ThuA domain-containing protein [Agromyces seonyuensis]
MRALILVGSGRYADPWHPLARTGDRLGEVIADAGFEVRVRDDVDDALAELDGLDLLVVNAADPWRNGEAAVGAPERSIAGLDAALERGMGVLGVHAAISSLRDYPRWAETIGGVWLPELSMHPPIGQAHVRIVADHPVTDDVADFEVFDELYSRLQRIGDASVLAEHEHDGRRHPLLWAREIGGCRVVYDALGHDERSYDAPEHRRLVRNAARWAVRD